MDSDALELSPAARAASFGSGLVHMVSDALGRLSRPSGGGGGGGSGSGCMTPAPNAATASVAYGAGSDGGVMTSLQAADAAHSATGVGGSVMAE